MKQTSLLITLLFLALTHSGNYTIESFETVRSVPQKHNDVISPVTGEELIAIQPKAANSGRFYLRRKYGLNNYGFYEGRLKKGAYEKLNCFKIEGNRLSENVRLKFYQAENYQFHMDIVDMYFEGNLIFVQNRMEIFFHQNGEMVKLTALPGKPGRLLISTSPSRATVLINNRRQGVTPLSLGGILDIGVLLRVEKDGYYPREDYVAIKVGEENSKQFLLSAEYIPESGKVDLSEIMKKNTEIPEELEKRISILKSEFEQTDAKGKKQQKELSRSYPRLSSKGEFELTSEYKLRSKKHKMEKEEAEKDLERKIRNNLTAIQSAINELKSYKTTVESKTFRKKLDIMSLKLVRYIADSGYFNVTTQIQEGPFDFKFTGKLMIPRDIARTLRPNKNKASFFIEYLNRAIQVKKGNKKTKRYIIISNAHILYQNKLYEIRGEFLFPSFVKNSLAYQQALKELKSYKTELESKTYKKKLSISALTLDRYKPDPEYFPVRVEVKEALFDFTFDGKLEIPISVAKNFKSNKNSASLSVYYVNKSLEVTRGRQRVKRHAFIKGLSIHFGGKKYDLEGKFKLPSYITNSQAYKEAQKAMNTPDIASSNKMVKIPKGCFDMGSKDGDDDEKPVHRVCLDEFWMDQYEVTQADYKKATGKSPSSFKNCPNCPIETVSWIEANIYCKELGKRLPTEAEWEYAARAGTTTRFYTGNCISTEQANYNGNYPPSGCPKGKYREKTLPVGSFPPNPWGIYDMSGNVWEWVSDWYGKDYYGKSHRNNPKGPSNGKYRVFRGGSWEDNGYGLRSARRGWLWPDNRGNHSGFRCARSIMP